MKTTLLLCLVSLAACDLSGQGDLERWNIVNDAGAKTTAGDNSGTDDDDNDVDVGICEHFDADNVCTDVVTLPQPDPDTGNIPKPAPDDDNVPVVSAAQRFKLAQEVIRNRCVDCHTDKHDKWDNWGEATYVDRGKVEIGNFSDSSMIKRLQNFGGNMPKDGNKLSNDEVAVLRDWIENIGKK